MWNYKKNEFLNFVKVKGCPSIVKYDGMTNKVLIGYFKHSEVEVYKVANDEIVFIEEFAIKNDFFAEDIVFSPINGFFALSLVSIGAHNFEGTTTASLSSASNCI